ncbi:hypothetical protein ABN034_32185 [Actinopolymorpha sp. B11F2]|uniref:hypothetical protein n=1 Tax=Actinopolymorpha sp. B11F2 TaxID=3160862 RepID=UPI0032E48AA1
MATKWLIGTALVLVLIGGCPATTDLEGARDLSWRNGRRAQASIQAVGEAVADEFGESAKEAPGGPLSRGYVGTALDDAARSLVIVVDPAMVDVERLASKLTAASGPGGVAVRVEATKVSIADLLAAEEVLRARDWHPNASTVGMSFGLDPAACRYEVTLSRTHEDVALALKDRLGELVDIRWGTPQRR